ncbi:hypothetical protein [Micromonospora sp. WMMD737]|uniref:hypothetical protein n=1 Tax=Micromonospora sp. WMMD737 TaxID=3404113 RepID=UPI003B938D70
MTSDEGTREPITVPRQPVDGIPQWADLLPTNAELVATIGALDAIRTAHEDAVARRTAAEADPNYTSIPEFKSPAALGAVDPDGPEWDRLIDEVLEATRAHYQALTDGQRAAQEAVQALAALANDLNRMLVFARDHDVIDGVALFVRRSNVCRESIQISSNAADVRRYVEAEKQAGGWLVQLGDLDVAYRSPAGYPTLTAADADEVIRVGLAYVLEPLRTPSGVR